MKNYLFTPGPVPVTEETALAGARPLIGHRGRAFHKLFLSIQQKLGRLLRSEKRVVIFPASGTGALEALASNFMDADTDVLSISCGVFGDRFREIAARYGARISPVNLRLGSGVTPDSAARSCRRNPNCSIVLLTQNETSTGVLNPIKEIAAAIRKQSEALIFVDGVSSVGAAPCYPEEWGVDGLAFASQKGLLTAPGMGFVWLSQRAEELLAAGTPRSYYFDLKLQKKQLDNPESPENPYTPPVSLYYQLDAALDEILSDGWFSARRRAARALCAGIEALGFTLLVENEKFRSPGVTAFGSGNLDIATVAASLRAMGIEPAGGQGDLKGKIIRIAHYHDVNWPEIALILGSLFAASRSANPARETVDFMSKALDEWEGK